MSINSSKVIGIQFSILSPDEIRKSSVAEITSRDTYINNKPVIGGLFDPRMGVLEPGLICPTDGLDYMQTHNIRPMSWNPLGTVFREDIEQTRRLKKLLLQLVSKYGVGSDTILLAWVLKHPANVIPVAGTVNVARIQALMKATTLQMETEDWFAIWTESMGNRVP
jgi:predicted oxidoreductase